MIDGDITYWINYQKRGDDTWYTAGFDEQSDLKVAQDLAMAFLLGEKHPRAAGQPSIVKVQIHQVVSIGSYIWEAE